MSIGIVSNKQDSKWNYSLALPGQTGSAMRGWGKTNIALELHFGWSSFREAAHLICTPQTGPEIGKQINPPGNTMGPVDWEDPTHRNYRESLTCTTYT